MDFEGELRREIMQRSRAIAAGALVRPPRNGAELAADERANQAEIDRLEERRELLYRQLGQPTPDRVRSDLSFDLDSCSKALSIAFADRRRLRVARQLFREGIFA